MKTHARNSEIEDGNWLPDMDLNHDKQIQSLLCYRYTIGQTCAHKVGPGRRESRLGKAVWRLGAISGVAPGKPPQSKRAMTRAVPRKRAKHPEI